MLANSSFTPAQADALPCLVAWAFVGISSYATAHVEDARDMVQSMQVSGGMGICGHVKLCYSTC